MITAKPSVVEKRTSSVPAGLLKACLSLFTFALLSGCQEAVLWHPKGQVGAAEKDLIITTVLLMLIVVIPVLVLTLYFAWRYRDTNPKKVGHAPRWADSHTIEVVVWTIPALIVLTLSVITWQSSHALDPYKPLTIDGNPNVKHLEVDVVALDWNWLFIYPEQGVASLNQLVFPAHVPVAFNITSDSVMNSFFIPQLGGQIYAMAGMRTKLHLIADEPGTYQGLSANYSGAGYADMRFKAIATTDASGFNDWVAKVKASGNALDLTSFKQLANTPSPIPAKVVHEGGDLSKVLPPDHVPVRYFGTVSPHLFNDIIGQFHYAAPAHAHHAEGAESPSQPADHAAMPAMSGAHE